MRILLTAKHTELVLRHYFDFPLFGPLNSLTNAPLLRRPIPTIHSPVWASLWIRVMLGECCLSSGLRVSLHVLVSTYLCNFFLTSTMGGKGIIGYSLNEQHMTWDGSGWKRLLLSDQWAFAGLSGRSNGWSEQWEVPHRVDIRSEQIRMWMMPRCVQCQSMPIRNIGSRKSSR